MKRVGRERGRSDLTGGERPAEVPARSAAEQVLALQRSAGNRAVGSMLARDATTAEPADAKPADEKAPGSRCVYPGIGTIPLLAVQLGGSSIGRGRRNPDAEDSGEIVVVSEQGEHSAKLMQEAQSGSGKDVEIQMTGLKILLKNALISAYSVDSRGDDKPTESWTLSYQSISYEVKP